MLIKLLDMKEIKLDSISQVESIRAKIWSIFDILRSESIPQEEYHVLLFLMSAYKDGLFNKEIVNEKSHISTPENNLSAILISKLYNCEEVVIEKYSSILNVYEPIINRISNTGINNIIIRLCELNREILNEHFSEVFDSILYSLAQSQGRYGDEFIQPLELTRFTSGLAELEPNSKVYNPFAGLASFGLHLAQGQDYFGQELNRKTWALGALRLMAYQKFDVANYVCDDSTVHWPPSSEKFDLVIANPPFRTNFSFEYIESYWETAFSKFSTGNNQPISFRSIEHFLLVKGVESLNENGKLIAILPPGILYKSSYEQRIREILIEMDLIDTIILLPGGLLFNIGIPLVIMVLSKNKKIAGKVKFVNGKKFVEAKGMTERILNDHELASFLEINKNDSDVIRYVSNDEIRISNYNLYVPRYFQEQIEGVKLGEIIEFFRGDRENIPLTGKLIRIRDLKDNNVDVKLDETTIEEVELRRSEVYKITESCLLLAVNWKKIKPTFFKYRGESIFRNQSILSFKVNEDIADIAYLINELHSDYVQKQLDLYRINSVIPIIRKDDLLEIKIKLTSIEEQRAKVQGIQELSDKIKSLEFERDTVARGNKLIQFNEFASLKHTLGAPRQNILSYTEALINFFEKNSSTEIDKVIYDFKEKIGVDLTSSLKAIRHDINFISEVLEKGENGLILNDYDLSIVSLTEVLKFVQQLCKNHNYNFLSTPPEQIHDLTEQDAVGLGIRVNLSLLKILVDNIFSNAKKYAFENKSFSSTQLVIVDLGIDGDSFYINIFNNGKPFPKNIDKEKFISKYKTSDTANGTGLGGYDINRISEYFESAWQLELNSDQFFPVQFHFGFKLLPIQ